MRHWLWLLIFGLILGGSAGYGFSLLQTPIYQTTTKIMLMRAPLANSNFNTTYMNDQQLVQNFIQLSSTKAVLDDTSNRLDTTVNGEKIHVQQVSDTNVITITVEDSEPEKGAAIANTLVKVLIEQSDSIQTGRYATTEDSVKAQIGQVESQIAGLQTQINQETSQNVQDQTNQVKNQIDILQSQIAQLDADINSLSIYSNPQASATLSEKKSQQDQLKSMLTLYQDIYSNLIVVGKPSGTSTTDRLANLQKTLDLYQQIYLQLLGSLEDVRLARLQNTPNAVQIEAASVPTIPVRPRPLQNLVLGSAIGLIFAAGIIFLVEYLDNTLRSPEDVEQILGLPILGYISEMQHQKDGSNLYVTQYPRSPATEAFRSLRTNLGPTKEGRPVRTILVTSARPSEGKSTIAANLAAIFAQVSRRVILVDADMRRPSIHRVVRIPNRAGLSTLLKDTLKPQDVWKKLVDAPELFVITGGTLPPNPTELLSSEKMLMVLSDLYTQADMIIIDSPPSIVADAQVLSSLVDGVILVIRPGKSQIDEVRATLTQLKRSGAHILGVVFNRIPPNRSQYYGGYRFYSPNSYSAYPGYNQPLKKSTQSVYKSNNSPATVSKSSSDANKERIKLQLK
jgi:capsular exopolysaccharide synthesis family protein